MDNRFAALMEFSSKYLDGSGVFILCIILTIIFVAVYSSKRSRQLLNSLPGLFTSLGLLGTFVAICHSLGNINPHTLEVHTIINELIPAFTSSISGLICAFCVTTGTKIYYAFEDKKLDNKVANISPEESLFKLSIETEKMNNIQMSIKELLISEGVKNAEYNNKLNTTICNQSKVLEQFINDFVTRMDDIFTKMHGQIEQNIKDFGEDQFRNCAATLTSLTTQLSNLSTSLLKDQKETVQQMIDGTNAELQNVSKDVQSRMTSIIEGYDVLATRLSNQNSDFATTLNAQFNKNYEEIQKQNVLSLQQMIDLKDDYQNVTATMLQNSVDMNKDINVHLRNSIEGFVSELHTIISSQVKQLSDSIASNVHALEQSYTYISEHVANIKGNYENSAQAFEDAVNNAHRMNETHEKLLNVVEDGYKQIAETNDNVETTINMIQERQEKIETLITHINEINTAIETLQKLESQLNRIVNR